MELRNRNEIPNEFKWDLSHIYATEQDWENAYNEAEARVNKIHEFEGTLSKSVESMKTALDYIYETGRQCELVASYAQLNKNGDNGDTHAQNLEGKAMRLYVNFETAMSFVVPEILSIDEETLKKFMADESLKTYRHTLEDIDRKRAHTLDAEREKMLAMLGNVSGGPRESYVMLASVDMTFPSMKGDDGKEIEISHGNFEVFRSSANQEIRKESFEKYFGTYEKYLNTFASMYANSVKFDQFYADVAGYKSACEAALFDGNVPMNVYDSLIEAVHSRLSTMRKYIELRKRALGLEELNMYDLYNPIVDDVDFDYDFEQAKKLVKEALAPLGEDYGKLLDMAFNNSWIDVYENRGKTTGAFSFGVFGVHPYVLLNFQNTLDNAFTLAHELGHAMHSYKSDHAQDFVNHDYRIFVAEVASTVNEVLLLKYMLSKETDKKRRAYLLNHFLESFRTTVFRQTLFAEFERKSHEMAQNGEPLTADSLSDVYKKLNELYYDGAVVNDLMRVEWARIPHFYRAFYVYQYATGFTSACAIATAILNDKTGKAVENYHKFLSTGGSDYPIEELKIAGVDLTTPAPVLSALDMFEDTVNELTALLDEIK